MDSFIMGKGCPWENPRFPDRRSVDIRFRAGRDKREFRASRQSFARSRGCVARRGFHGGIRRCKLKIMGAILDLPEMRAQVHRWAVMEYLDVAEDNAAFQRSELIRGIIVEKMPKSSLHEFLTEGIAEYFRRTARTGFLVRQEASLRLADSVPEPDVAVVVGNREAYRLRKPTTAELVVEVAFTSLALDREKALLYAEAGVVEYWIVLGEEERVEVYRQPTQGIYQKTQSYARGEVIESVGVTAEAVPVDALFV